MQLTKRNNDRKKLWNSNATGGNELKHPVILYLGSSTCSGLITIWRPPHSGARARSGPDALTRWRCSCPCCLFPGVNGCVQCLMASILALQACSSQMIWNRVFCCSHTQFRLWQWSSVRCHILLRHKKKKKKRCWVHLEIKDSSESAVRYCLLTRALCSLYPRQVCRVLMCYHSTPGHSGTQSCR